MQNLSTLDDEWAEFLESQNTSSGMKTSVSTANVEDTLTPSVPIEMAKDIQLSLIHI